MPQKHDNPTSSPKTEPFVAKTPYTPHIAWEPSTRLEAKLIKEAITGSQVDSLRINPYTSQKLYIPYISWQPSTVPAQGAETQANGSSEVDEQETEEYVPQPKIYELNSQQLVKQLTDVVERQEVIKESIANQQAVLQTHKDIWDTQEAKFVLYKVQQMHMALRLQEKRKGKMEELLRQAEREWSG
jgi:hypothetical protein